MREPRERPRRRIAAVLGAILVLLLPAQGEGADRPLLVSAASSLQDVIRRAAAVHTERAAAGTSIPIPILVQAGSSGALAVQITRGAPVDLFVSADEETAADLLEKGLLDRPISVIAENEVVIVAPVDLPLVIDRFEQMLDPAVRRVALPDTTVPIGRYGTRFLDATGLAAPLASRLVRTENVRASLAAAETGAVDLAIVYATDAAISDRVRVVATIPDSLTGPVRIVGAVVTASPLRDAAHSFLSFLLSPDGQSLLRQAGFRSVAHEDGESPPDRSSAPPAETPAR